MPIKVKDKDVEGRILIAAKKVFQSKGMEGARMQEIADEAGINKAMLHYYYRSKQQLFEAVFTQLFTLLTLQLNKALNDDSSLEEKIRNFTSNYISFIADHPYLPNFIIQEINRSPDFILKFRSFFPDLKKFKAQLEDVIPDEKIKSFTVEKLFVNVLSLNVFPFLAKPLLKAFLHIDENDFQQLMEQRKAEVAEIIINSIKYK
ncbi:transcriptional regulator, TetR family [Saccharicrinis carchari]|uniref:Transcriptional regulator, TetR family n=1 Tax=Saccharicrinis carchari TaxID=1168039 RepID=A0A521AWK3_SACCC|nr:TetR/AcrR family transcriptional regulator [Saccharicrinis carchari]SMO39101.1 transcriptional regulator, TetR family [Saccharicrinis carchari]